jgi:hypothetical protein
VHQIGAHESNEFEKAIVLFGDLLQGAQEKVGNQGHGDLDADGVFRSSDKFRNPERLLHHPEEQFDPPATLVEIGDFLRGRVEVIGEPGAGSGRSRF